MVLAGPAAELAGAGTLKVWPLVFALVLAAAIARRRRSLEPALLAGGALAVAGLIVYGTGLVELPNLEHALVSVGDNLGRWTYLLVGALAFLETGAFIGLLAPGETALILGGVVAGQGKISLVKIGRASCRERVYVLV